MENRQVNRSIIFVVALFAALACSGACASCSQGDLTGTWRIYSYDVISVNPTATWCKMVIGSSGAISKSASSCSDTDGFSGVRMSGTMKIASSCAIRPTTLTFYQGPISGTAALKVADMDRGKTVMVGLLISENGDPLVFNAVKR